MVISRIPLDISKRNTMRALANPNLIHGAIEKCFDDDRVRKLWRIDSLNGKCYLMILSESAQDLSLIEEEFGFDGNTPSRETKEYDKIFSKIDDGDCRHFRLIANPVISRKKDGSNRGKIYSHSTVAQQKKWLMERAEKYGFALDESEFMVVQKQWYHFNHGKEKQKVSLLAVTFEGSLKITNRSLFIEAMKKGIGKGKAYGLGMITIAK